MSLNNKRLPSLLHQLLFNHFVNDIQYVQSRTLLKHFFQSYFDRKQIKKKITFFDQKHGLTPLEKCGFWDFERLWRCGRIRCMRPPGSACVMQECAFLFSNRTIGTNGPSELPCTQPGHMEHNLSPLNEMHIHQQNHWNDMLFYWYQWTIGIALYPARLQKK